MGRRINDGAKTGLKQDKFRNSRFEFEPHETYLRFQGVSRKTPNTIGGAWEENRGRRNADEAVGKEWEDSPFEDGKLYNWNQRQGWDEHFKNLSSGGALIGRNTDYRGRGPKGYKRGDDSIYEDVCDTLYASSEVDASEIEVKVEEGIVYLEGNVPDRLTKKRAELAIENISGVFDVFNRLGLSRNTEDVH